MCSKPLISITIVKPKQNLQLGHQEQYEVEFIEILDVKTGEESGIRG